MTSITRNSGTSGNFGSGGTASEAVVAVGTAFGCHCPNLPLIFTDGTIWSPSTLICLQCYCCTGGWLFLGLGLYLYGRFGIIAAAVLLVGGTGQSFLSSKMSLTFFLLQTLGC